MRVQDCGPYAICLTSGGAAPLNLDSGRVTIVGNLFHRFGAGPSLAKLDPSSVAQVLSDPAHVLLSRYWGAYVALWTDGDVVTVLRDPSGLLPCWYTVQEGYTVFASDPDLLYNFTGRRPSIDWTGIANLLYADDLAQVRTGLTDVSHLLAGSAVHIDETGCRQINHWSPWQFVSRNDTIDYRGHIERLRRAVELCVRGWSASFSKVLLAVSGGLDSSIVASCLDPNTAHECITMATDDPRGDETEYAKELCSNLSVALACFRYRLEDADVLRSAVAHLPRPGARTPMVAYDAAIGRYIDQIGADLFLTGAGGDNVFYLTHSIRPVVDRFLAEGLTLGLLGSIRDVAQITEASTLEVVRQALQFLPTRKRKYQWRYDESLLHWDCIGKLKHNPPDHPWLAAPHDGLPGKAGHIAMITRAQQYLHGYDRKQSFTSVAPLLSQPIIEAALSIPSWLSCEGGMDRSVARKAFEERIPMSIFRRRTKGGPDAFALKILRANMPLIRERLLTGNLARNGILDLSAVEDAMTFPKLATNANYVRLLLLLDTEAWIDGWLCRSTDMNKT
nr:asparagine synthase C-terminal domain-containing protein [Blastomonas sp. CCH13-E1]